MTRASIQTPQRLRKTEGGLTFRRANLSVRRLFAAIFGLALFTMAVRETLDPDMWWHLRTGEFILQEGIPRSDVFSYTVPSHEWIAHEWLSQVFMWLVYQLGGLAGLAVVFAAITALTFWLIYLRSGGRPYLAAFVVLLSALASAHVWGVRPQMFNGLLAATFVFVLEGVKGKVMERRWLWLLPGLMIIWANLHSGYLLGIALLAAHIVGECIQLLAGVRSKRELSWGYARSLALVLLVSFLAAALNPNGPALWTYPFFTLGSSAMQQFILEWRSPDFHQTIFWPFAVLMGVGVVSWLLARQRPDWTDVLLFGGTAAAGLVSARHIPLFAVVSAPIVSRNLFEATRGTRLRTLAAGGKGATLPTRAIALNWLLLALVAVAATVWIVEKVDGNSEAIARRYPVDAVNFVQEQGLSERRIYNSYNWGGYLIWRGLPVFVDGRADVYGDEFLFYYRQTFDLTGRWREPLEDFDVEYVLMEEFSSLNTLLATSGDWDETYRDDVAAVYVRAEG